MAPTAGVPSVPSGAGRMILIRAGGVNASWRSVPLPRPMAAAFWAGDFAEAFRHVGGTAPLQQTRPLRRLHAWKPIRAAGVCRSGWFGRPRPPIPIPRGDRLAGPCLGGPRVAGVLGGVAGDRPLRWPDPDPP